MANLEIRLEQEVGGIVKTPFSGIFNWCPVRTPQSKGFKQGAMPKSETKTFHSGVPITNTQGENAINHPRRVL